MRRSRLTHSQDTMANKQDYVDLGLSCADVCKALERGMGGKKLDDVSQSVRDAIKQLTTWVEPAIYISCSSTYHGLDRRTVAKIQEKVMKRSGRHRIVRFFRSSDDKDAIAAWKSDLNWILRVFDVCSPPSRLSVANHSVHRLNLSSTPIQLLLVCVRMYRKSVRSPATRIGWYVTCILFAVFQFTLTATCIQNRSGISTTETSESNICIQRAWGTATFTARDLLRTRRVDREDR